MVKESLESSGDSTNGDESLEKKEFEKRFRIGSKTLPKDYGDPEPRPNGDSILINEEEGIFAVFDELGDSGGKAADWLASYIEDHPEELSSSSLSGTIKAAEEIFIKAEEKFKEETTSGLTTASLVKIWEGGKEAGERREKEKIGVVANLGDSRVYVKRSDGKLKQVTVDDGPLRFLKEERNFSIYRQGREEEIEITAETLKLIDTEKKIKKLQKRLNNCQEESELDEEEQKLFKLRNRVINSWGHHSSYELEPRIYIIKNFLPGDRILIVSDGVSDNLTDEEMNEIFDKQGTEQEIAEGLINNAQERSRNEKHFRAKPDDMTAVVVGLPRK